MRWCAHTPRPLPRSTGSTPIERGWPSCGRAIAGLRETAAVAESLGRLLSATGFEAWLMGAALAELCARATDRLLTLSGGQFSLVVDDREFLVRDHANADELRNVRTLSGGETFLASLALALALAEATAELAPAGAPTIESIFLDEGFGTLDPDTMETVAGAIEELGASGRMVAIVTHIRELAERMPVRLEVTKTATGSTVRRVEVLMRFAVEAWAPEYGVAADEDDPRVGRRARRRRGRGARAGVGADPPGERPGRPSDVRRRRPAHRRPRVDHRRPQGPRRRVCVRRRRCGGGQRRRCLRDRGARRAGTVRRRLDPRRPDRHPPRPVPVRARRRR